MRCQQNCNRLFNLWNKRILIQIGRFSANCTAVVSLVTAVMHIAAATDRSLVLLCIAEPNLYLTIIR